MDTASSQPTPRLTAPPCERTVAPQSLAQRPSVFDRIDTKALRISFDLVVLLVQRDLRVRYRGSFLGYLWSMMNPLLYMAILSFVFAHLMRYQIQHFSEFILSGIMVWNLFQQSMVIGVNSIVANGALLRKVKVPATLFPLASVCSVLVNFCLALGPYLLIALISGVSLTGWILLLPLVLVPYLLFIFGAALFVATLNVSFRDVGHVLEPILQMVFYATPVIYPVERLPENYRRILNLNPMTHYLATLRSVLFEGTAPSAQSLLIAFGLAVVSLTAGIFVYRKHRDGFIYNL